MIAPLENTMNPPCATSFRRPVRSRRPPRRQFVPERLEDRYLPAVALPGITATGPADGANVYKAPQVFTITFDPEVVKQVEAAVSQDWSIDPDQALPFLIEADLGQDVEIDRVGADGSLTPYAGGPAGAVQESISTTTVDGTTRTQMVVTLTSGTPAMQPGTYDLEILPATFLSYYFGSVTDPSWYSAPGPIPIAEFTVPTPGIKLAAANELGTVGATAQTVWGSLKPSNVPSAVSLYRFTLPALPGGHLWQLDAQVLADAVGSRLPPAMALFGPDGSVLATGNSGTGPLDDPVDPELFRDLPAGAYTLGISAAGNLPGTAGGYDPNAGIPGTEGVDQPGGVFELKVTAIPAVPPSSLVDFSLDQADALEPSPTGLDLTFSRPVNESPLTVPDRLETALTVVNASGQTWPITLVGDADSGDRLNFTFNEPLPAGSYSLVVPSQGGLTDLAGNLVVGPSGSPPGVLATWTVAAPTATSDPDNLGVLWPGPSNVTYSPGISRTDTIDPGQEVADRFVVICPGVYTLQTQIGPGSIDVRIVGVDGTTVMDVNDQSGLSHSYFELGAGVYDLQMTANGSEAAAVAWLLRPLSLRYDKITTNGVGQAPALTLALVAPMTVTAESSGNSGWSGPPSTVATALTSTETTAGASGRVGNGGRPGRLADEPGDEPGRAPDVGWVAHVRGRAAGRRGHGRPGRRRPRPAAGDAVPAVVGDGSAGRRGRRGDRPGGDVNGTAFRRRAGPVPGGLRPRGRHARADATALAIAQADPLVRIAGWFAGRLPAPSASPREPETPATDLGATLLAAEASGDADADAPARDRGRSTLAQADLGVPFALLVGTALTYRLSQPIRKWWRRHDTAHPSLPRPYGMARADMTVRRV